MSMAIRSAVAGLLPLACACAAAQPGGTTHGGDQSGVAARKPEKLEPFVAPPEPLRPPPSVVLTLAGDSRFVVSERPELRAFVLMVLPVARHRAELLTVLDAWLRDESLLGESPMKDVPCANGAVCLTLPPRNQESLIERVRTGIGADAEGLGRATTRARTQIADTMKSSPGIAEFVLSSAPSLDHWGARYLDEMGPRALGSGVQEVLDHSTFCLVVPSASSARGAAPSDAAPEVTHSPSRQEPIQSAEIMLVPRASDDQPYLAWSIRSAHPEGHRQNDTLAAELILARMGAGEPSKTWSRLERVAGAGRSIEEDRLVDVVQQLQSAFARSVGGASADQESEVALRAARLHRVDFGVCERSTAESASPHRLADIVIVGPASLAQRLEAAGVSVRILAPAR